MTREAQDQWAARLTILLTAALYFAFVWWLGAKVLTYLGPPPWYPL